MKLKLIFRARRRRLRNLGVLLGASTAALFSQSSNAGQVYTVTTATGMGTGSIYWAIQQAVSNGSGAGIINITNNLGIINAANLPDLTVGVTINGGTGNTLSGQGLGRILFVNSGNQPVIINSLNFANGAALGGNGGSGGGGGGAGLGGAVFINSGAVTFSSTTFSADAATGGTGGDAGTGGGGGGGGLDFAGGNGAAAIGAGGGGGAHTSLGFAATGSTSGAGGGAHGGAGGPSTGTNLNGGAGTLTDGGGGGGGLDSALLPSVTFGGNGGAGSDFGGGGGAGGSLFSNGGTGGAGGFGAGGGGGAAATGSAGPGGAGGFGGGGGGVANQSGGSGGSAFGAAVFVRTANGASVSFINTSIDAGSVTGGAGGSGTANGSAGSSAGSAMFLMGGTANLNVSVAGATQTIAGSIGQSATSSISKTGPGTLVLSGDNAGTYQITGSTTVSAGKLILNSATAFPKNTALSIASGATTVAANVGTRYVVQTSALTIAAASGTWTGKLDLSSNDLTVQGGNLASVTSQVKQGFSGGSWLGANGITSSSAATDASFLTALGVIQNNQNGSPVYDSVHRFDGIIPGASDVLVKYTYYGDANLDGKIDGTDYNQIDFAYTNTGPGARTGWANGDFNYDGFIDGSDYSLIDNAFNRQTTLPSIHADTIASPLSIVSVPEPMGLGIVAMSLIVLKGRGRTRPCRR